MCRPLIALLAALAPSISSGAAVDDGPVSYHTQVAPLLKARCAGCHHPGKAKGGLDLTTHEALSVGGDTGVAVAPCAPHKSLLIELIRSHEGAPPAMPAKGEPLSESEVMLLERWVEEGASSDSPSVSLRVAETPAVYERPPVVTDIAFSPDGTTLAVSGYGEVLLCAVAGDAAPRRAQGLAPRIESLSFSPDGTHLAVVGGWPGEEGRVSVRDLSGGSWSLQRAVTADSLFGVSWSPDGARIAFGATDRTLRALDATSGEQVLFQKSHQDWVLDTVWSSDGSHLVSVGRDRTMKLVKVESEQFIDDITSITPGALKGGLQAVARRPGKDELLVGGADGEPKLYRMYREKKRVIGDDYNAIRAYEGLPGRVFALAWEPSGARFAAASSSDGTGTVRVFGADDGSVTWTSQLGSAMYSVAWSPAADLLAFGGVDGQVHLVEASTGEPIRSFTPVPIKRKI